MLAPLYRSSVNTSGPTCCLACKVCKTCSTPNRTTGSPLGSLSDRLTLPNGRIGVPGWAELPQSVRAQVTTHRSLYTTMFGAFSSSSAGWNGHAGPLGRSTTPYTWAESQDHDDNMDASGESYESPEPNLIEYYATEDDAGHTIIPETIPETQMDDIEGKKKPAGKPWTRDNVDGVSAEKLLVDWLCEPGIWQEWRDGKAKTKAHVYGKFRQRLLAEGYQTRDDNQIYAKVSLCATSLVIH